MAAAGDAELTSSKRERKQCSNQREHQEHVNLLVIGLALRLVEQEHEVDGSAASRTGARTNGDNACRLLHHADGRHHRHIHWRGHVC